MLDKLERIGKHVLPPGLVKGVLGQPRIDRIRARLLATGAKRVDLCAAQIAHVLHLAGRPSLRDAVCLELGSGWVLSHALVLHLLGAKRVVASDLDPLAQPGVLAATLGASEISIVRDILSPFEEHQHLRSRLERLLKIDTFSLEVLEELGIEYRAPLDLARQPLGTPLDLVFSWSVLEHVPRTVVPALLANLAEDLRPGGRMIHAIHLEDHRDHDGDPFAFLGEPGETYLPESENERGNRLRQSEWLRLFGELAGVETTPLFSWSRNDRPLPAQVDADVVHTDEADLRVTHLGLHSVRKP